MTALVVEDLTAGYGAAVVLSGVDLEVAMGESVALVGRNGAGKSTLLLSPFGETTIHGGSIRIDGHRLDGRRGRLAARHGLAIAPQGRRILPHLTVRENLLLGAASRRKGPWTPAAVHELFPVLADRAGRPGAALSGGQQQMLSIGRALLANPAVLLLDEPSEGLAPVVVDELVDAFGRIRSSGTGLLVVEQHLPLVERVAERFVVLTKGRVSATGDITSDAGEGLRAAVAL